MFKIGDNVLYEFKNYVILWIYENGNCELTERHSSVVNTILVHMDHLEKAKQKC
ncbi:hypothetical protein [Litchfieldia salsa]|uniref:Uncharacterized protein n=1 Tax=Litchfieldia salsa TaxID=930152 RepID=A0A1H0PE40_9BACI|nr:hypothetical protein [Litchfieldia salsa]SDP02876.1 hypothetical protein SAMN05216565_101262 [Litchfieldia salsa]